MRTKNKDKYNSLIKESIKLVNELGFAGISIKKIAKKAKISPATVYVYFDDKADLFISIYENIRNEMSERTLNGIDYKMDVEKQFKLIWHNFFRFSLENPEYLLYREHFEQTIMMDAVDKTQFELFNHIPRLFKKGIKEGIIKDLPIPLLLSFAFIPIITLLKFHFNDTLKMDENLIEKAKNMAWDIIEASPP